MTKRLEKHFLKQENKPSLASKNGWPRDHFAKGFALAMNCFPNHII
ncbi:MAG: hypothetical protein CM1200mP29_02750 [Verrucomicrobiota bacterium]|nr:MAG: hypothetical protein CM1200mP29_02750 [Verrucomicrobiota bacterium]